MLTKRNYLATYVFLVFPLSDPYVKVTVYDPVNGVLSSVQTKTIRKVSLLVFVDVGFISFIKL